MSLVGQCYYRIAATRIGHQAARATLGAARCLGALQGFHMPLDGLNLPHAGVRELMRLWQRIHWTSGDGMMTPQERLAIYRLAYDCPVEGDHVELGAWKGLTTCYLAAARRARGRGQVFAVDTFEGTREHNTQYASIGNYDGSTLPAFKAFLSRAGLDAEVTPYVGYTTEMAKRHADRPVAFLLIDADHSYEGVKADFETWFPLVAPGGTVVFHDYAMLDGGVRDFVDAEVVGRADLRDTPGNILPNMYVVTKSTAAAPVGTKPERVLEPLAR